MPAPASLRERLKQETRARLEKAAVQLLTKQGYQATSVDQIVKLAGTTRTTFYDYFASKSELIHVVQERHIAPALKRLCEDLDAQVPLTHDALRRWINDYSVTWARIHVFFEAYGDASRTDPKVAATILPNSYAVTAGLQRLLASLGSDARQRLHDQLVLMFTNLDNLMYQVSMVDPSAAERLLDAFAALYWQGLFKDLPRGRSRMAK